MVRQKEELGRIRRSHDGGCWDGEDGEDGGGGGDETETPVPGCPRDLVSDDDEKGPRSQATKTCPACIYLRDANDRNAVEWEPGCRLGSGW